MIVSLNSDFNVISSHIKSTSTMSFYYFNEIKTRVILCLRHWIHRWNVSDDNTSLLMANDFCNTREIIVPSHPKICSNKNVIVLWDNLFWDNKENITKVPNLLNCLTIHYDFFHQYILNRKILLILLTLIIKLLYSPIFLFILGMR